MKNEEALFKLPPHTAIGIERYVDGHMPVGSFLEAVFANDLFKAVAYADQDNLKALKQIVSYVFWETPGECRGSSENVKAWLAQTQGGK